MTDPIKDEFDKLVGQSLSKTGPNKAADPVNIPMIRHWVDAFDDQNPVYLNEIAAEASHFKEIVAPPAMMQTWTFPRPIIKGIRERGGSPQEVDEKNPLKLLDNAGYIGTVATNSELEFDRYLRPGDHLQSESVLESISEKKSTALGVGYFVTMLITYSTLQGEVIGRQKFRMYKFNPDETPKIKTGKPKNKPEIPKVIEELPCFELEVTAAVVIAGAIATRDFMPVHHDRDYAQAQGAPDIFMNILTSNGYMSRYVTDWTGPDAMIKNISIRLGAQCIPGHILRFAGQVIGQREENREVIKTVSVVAACDLGNHAVGTVTVAIPI
tara:strand:- start:317 stop:1294 length:978 start_codon:yes stop_codon:yes gene_type:complete